MALVAEILILEDDTALRRTVGHALRLAGYGVHEAATCAEAIEALGQGCPDLIVMDLKIGTGLSLSVADYAAMRWPELPVICVTGCGMFAHGELFEMGRNIQCVLRKPVSLCDLCSTVAHLLRSQPGEALARQMAC